MNPSEYGKMRKVIFVTERNRFDTIRFLQSVIKIDYTEVDTNNCVRNKKSGGNDYDIC